MEHTYTRWMEYNIVVVIRVMNVCSFLILPRMDSSNYTCGLAREPSYQSAGQVVSVLVLATTMIGLISDRNERGEKDGDSQRFVFCLLLIKKTKQHSHFSHKPYSSTSQWVSLRRYPRFLGQPISTRRQAPSIRNYIFLKQSPPKVSAPSHQEVHRPE